jgi:hypothetical protein
MGRLGSGRKQIYEDSKTETMTDRLLDLSGDTGALHSICRDPLLWELVLRALSSASHVAVAGGLAFLKNMSPSLCPSPALVDVSAALLRLTVTAAANPFLAGKLRLLTEWTG